MAEFLDHLGDAVVVVLGGWTLLRLACGWRLEWRPPITDEKEST